MDISHLKELKKQSGFTNNQIAELSGIPLSTVNKIFSGVTANPRYATLLAIEEVLVTKEKVPFTYDKLQEMPIMARESAVPYQYHSREYSDKDVARLEEGTRAELIKGQLYMLAAPSRMHQFLLSKIMFQIQKHIEKNKCGCHAYIAPFDVRLFGDNSTVVQPDISVICKKDLLSDRGCEGAPDWLIEVISSSNSKHDYVTKLMQYQKSGVREYWIIDPFQRMTYVYNFENPQLTDSYTYEECVPSSVLQGLEITLEEIEKQY